MALSERYEVTSEKLEFHLKVKNLNSKKFAISF